jgi:hypothetical protein
VEVTFFEAARNCACKVAEVIKFDQKNPFEAKVVTSYLFGMLTMLGSDMDADGSEIQASLVAALVHNFHFSELEASKLSSHAIHCTEKAKHPTQFTVIGRGLESYVDYYQKGDYKEIQKDVSSIFDIVRECQQENIQQAR